MTVPDEPGEVRWLCLPASRRGRPCHALAVWSPVFSATLRDYLRGCCATSANRALPAPAAQPASQPIISKILNIGMYSAMTMPPTMPPMTPIISGSIIAVSCSVVASTSVS